jgi:hypothetical protein
MNHYQSRFNKKRSAGRFIYLFGNGFSVAEKPFAWKRIVAGNGEDFIEQIPGE